MNNTKRFVISENFQTVYLKDEGKMHVINIWKRDNDKMFFSYDQDPYEYEIEVNNAHDVDTIASWFFNLHNFSAWWKKMLQIKK